jgi:hypothetical protein
MQRKQQAFMVAVALIAGLVGGLVSSLFLSGQPVFAEKKPPHEPVVRAELFELVDEDGNLRGSLAASHTGFVTLKLSGKRSSFLHASLGRTLANLEFGTFEHGKIDVRVDKEGLQLRFFDQLRPPRVRAVLGDVKLAYEDTGGLEDRGPASLVLFDEEGKVLWKAP